MIHTQGAQNTARGQIRTIKDRTTDPTKASATPQTKKRLPRAQVAHFTAAVYTLVHYLMTRAPFDDRRPCGLDGHRNKLDQRAPTLAHFQ